MEQMGKARLAFVKIMDEKIKLFLDKYQLSAIIIA